MRRTRERRLPDALLRDTVDSGAQFFKAVFKTYFRGAYLTAGILFGLWGVFYVLGPAVLLKNLIEWLEEEDEAQWKGWLLAASFSVTQLLVNVTLNRGLSSAYFAGIACRSGAMSLVYSKALSLQNAATIVGEITNLVANDTERLFEVSG